MNLRLSSMLMCGLLLLSSCTPKTSNKEASHVEGQLTETISKYVTCPVDTVEMMLAASDSICQVVDTCSLELLGLDNEDVNKRLYAQYGKAIPTILKLYGSYDVMTSFQTNEANAAFAWHEVADALMANYFGKEEVDTADVERLFNAIDNILDCYACGSQRDMNMTAWRWAMLHDYKLIEAYKALYDCCNQPSLLKSVHGSYLHLFELYRNRQEQIDGHWSDLPRQLACMQMDMMDERRKFIEGLTTQYKQGKLSIQALQAELDKRPADVEWSIDDY